MQNFFIRSLCVPAAVVFLFALTFVILFRLNQNDFVQILASAPKVVTPSARAAAEHRQFVYWNFHTTEIDKMILDLQAERADIQKREEAVAAGEARIIGERRENERARDEIARARKELSDYIISVGKDETARMREQVSILSNMDPQNVVAVFNEKSDLEVVKILALMKPDLVAQVLEAMMAQTPEPNKPTPEKRAATLLDMLKRFRQEDAAAVK